MTKTDDGLFDVPEQQRGGRAELSAVIKRARDIMRKDAGLNGDLDRIPQFSWLLFLKALDAREDEREVTEGARFRPLLDEPYRWRDWAAPDDPKKRVTGQPLQDFINGQLLPYLRKQTGTDELDVIGTIFRDVQNRMLSGNLLREVVDQIDKVDFHAAADVHTIAHLYESMLQEMRDAAGDSGEFYTPRPVIGFMVRMIHPRPAEIVLDPACGTGGFLVEAYKHIRLGNKLRARQLRDLEDDIQGIDKKPLPYLLATMNLLLHGVDRPHVVRDNALNHPVAEHRRNRVDVILTNPPFGGEEESTVPKNFPTDTRTPKTEWLFIQLVIERLRTGGRCAIVVPNNILFDGGVGAKVKQKLLATCNVHTIVRLPNGVFAPYTLIPANLLFFEKSGPTKVTWFYELPPPEGRRNYTKTKPLRDEEMSDLEAWWGGQERLNRVEGPHAWRVPIGSIIESGFNLDLRNPNGSGDLAHRPLAGVYGFGRGLFARGPLSGKETSYKRLHRLHAGQVVLSRLKAFEGAIAVVPPEFDGWVLSPEFPTFSARANAVHPGYLAMLCEWSGLREIMQKASRGIGARRERVSAAAFLDISVPIPDMGLQQQLATIHAKNCHIRRMDGHRRQFLDSLKQSALNQAFGGLA